MPFEEHLQYWVIRGHLIAKALLVLLEIWDKLDQDSRFGIEQNTDTQKFLPNHAVFIRELTTLSVAKS